MSISQNAEIAILNSLIAKTEQDIFAVSMELEAAKKTDNKRWIETCEKVLSDKRAVVSVYNEQLSKRKEQPAT